MVFQHIESRKRSKNESNTNNKETQGTFVSSSRDQKILNGIKFRIPGAQDGANVFELIHQCSPLEVNSPYSYLLLCRHFSDTCVIAEKEGQLVGFLSAYRKPREKDVLFVWQVAVHPGMRGRGIAKGMIKQALASNSRVEAVHFLEATVTTTNQPSFDLFSALARELNTDCIRNILFSREDFGSQFHEDEWLLRIGPIPEGGIYLQ